MIRVEVYELAVSNTEVIYITQVSLFVCILDSAKQQNKQTLSKNVTAYLCLYMIGHAALHYTNDLHFTNVHIKRWARREPLSYEKIC